jgi:hypothetical protein
MQLTLLAITLVSAAVAIVMASYAWRVIRDEQRRSEARVAGLAAAIDDDEATVVAHEPASEQTVPDWTLGNEPVALAGDMFAVAQKPAPSRFRLVGIAGAGALVMVAIVTTAVAAVSIGGRTRHAAAPAPAAAVADKPAAAPQEAPALELIALGHERDRDHLTVRGVVRNPAAGAEVRQVNAVVLLFDHDGGFVATGRAPVDGADLAPGAERTFVVSVPAGANVERYRVSFRSNDHVVPHVDRRSSRT